MARSTTCPLRRDEDALTQDAPDAALLGAALAGDEQAARCLVRRHGARMHACALRMLGDAGTAEEIVQDVFTQLFRSGRTIRSQTSIGAWLFTATLNRCRDVLRRRSFGHEMKASTIGAAVADGAPDPYA